MLHQEFGATTNPRVVAMFSLITVQVQIEVPLITGAQKGTIILILVRLVQKTHLSPLLSGGGNKPTLS